jgi:hypothetical protein
MWLALSRVAPVTFPNWGITSTLGAPFEAESVPQAGDTTLWDVKLKVAKTVTATTFPMDAARKNIAAPEQVS